MSSTIPEYDEIKLRLERATRGSYRVVASTADGSTARGSFKRPWNADQLDNVLLRIGQPRRTVRGNQRSSQMEEAKRFGGELFKAVINGDVAQAFDGARRVANSSDRGLRVTLELSSVPELMEIPWELLYERPTFLAQSIYTPVVRSLDLKLTRPVRKVVPPLRILAMISAPRGAAALDTDSERAKLEQALAGLETAGLVELMWLERATMAELDRRIGSPDDIHVLHYIGHGAYDEATSAGILILEDDEGLPHEVSGQDLAALLIDERSLRLAVLNSCEGARTSHVDPFSGVATSLVECGIEAVVGMQFEITDDAAVAFSERLYTALSQGFAVDAALAQARRAIYSGGNGVEFATPVLFLRGNDARLFDIDPAAATPKPAPPPAPPADGTVKRAAPASPDGPASSDGPASPAGPASSDGPVAPAAPAAKSANLVARAWSALRGDRRRLAGAVVVLAAVVVAVVLLLGGSGSDRPAERKFVTQVSRLLQRSIAGLQDVSAAAGTLKELKSATASSESKGASRAAKAAAAKEEQKTLDTVEDQLERGRTNRSDLASETRLLVTPTAQAHRIRTLLARAFDRSLDNDEALRRCIPRSAATGLIEFAGKVCVDSAATYSSKASAAKAAFLDEYNRLRSDLGLSELRPTF